MNAYEELDDLRRRAGRWEVGPSHRFEAGTPPIAQAIGLSTAVDYLSAIGMTKKIGRAHV